MTRYARSKTRPLSCSSSFTRRMSRIFATLFFCLAMCGNAQALALLDMAILVDSSGSVGADNWPIEQAFVNDLIMNELRPDDRVGIIQFATGLGGIYDLIADQTRSVVTTWVDALPYMRGSANTPLAIGHALGEFFTNQSSPSHDKVMVIITDGPPYLSSGPTGVCQLANELRSEGIETIVVGVGSGFNRSHFDCLVTTPDAIFEFANFNDLDYGAIAPALDPFLPGIPEPGTASLLGLGLIGLGLRSRSKSTEVASPSKRG
jgi:hypothetical protein